VKFEIRTATPADRETIQRLIAISARELSRGHYSEEQISAALKSVYGVDSMLIEDGTYFVAETDGAIIGCGGWSKRKTLFGGDQFSKRDAERYPAYEAHLERLSQVVESLLLTEPPEFPPREHCR